MATSSIGPAFLTQTSLFTEKYLASFAFAILVSLLIDIGASSTSGGSSPSPTCAARMSPTG